MGTIKEIRTPTMAMTPSVDNVAAVFVEVSGSNSRECVLVFGPGVTRWGANPVIALLHRMNVTLLSGGCSLRPIGGLPKVVTEGSPTFRMNSEDELEVVVNSGSLCVWLIRPEPAMSSGRYCPPDGSITTLDPNPATWADPSTRRRKRAIRKIHVARFSRRGVWLALGRGLQQLGSFLRSESPQEFPK